MGSQVLAEEENNAKALFRRGKARAELGQTDAAREDYLKVRKFALEDKAVAFAFAFACWTWQGSLSEAKGDL